MADVCVQNGNLNSFKKAKLENNNLDAEVPVLKFMKTSENAITPTRGSPLSAGYDLYSAVDCTISSGGKAIISTDIKIALPHGYYGRVAPRSGLAAKFFLDVGAGDRC